MSENIQIKPKVQEEETRYEPFDKHWNNKEIHKADDIEKSFDYFMKNPEMKNQYFEPDFVSLDPPGIEIQIPFGSESNSWYQKNNYIPLKKDIMKKNETKKIKWDDQRFFLRVKKKVREDLDFSGLQDKTIIFMPTDESNQRLLARYDGMERKPHRATGFLFLRNVITLK